MIDLAQFDGHTPGPWRWEDRITDDPWDLNETQHKVALNVSLRTIADAPVFICEAEKVTRSNAALLAAAPDLLAEVKELRMSLDSVKPVVEQAEEEVKRLREENAAYLQTSQNMSLKYCRAKAELSRLNAALDEILLGAPTKEDLNKMKPPKVSYFQFRLAERHYELAQICRKARGK